MAALRDEQDNERPPVTELHVVQNWFEELKRKVPPTNQQWPV
jgi:hypothetical protein